RHDHLPIVLRLRLLAALELDPGQLGDALDELGDLVAELVADLLDVGLGVLDDVVQQGGRDRLLVETELGADLGGAPRVVDEVLAGAALLPFVPRGGECEGSPQQVLVEVLVVGSDIRDELFDQLLMSSTCFENSHTKSVLVCFRAKGRHSHLPKIRRHAPPQRGTKGPEARPAARLAGRRGTDEPTVPTSTDPACSTRNRTKLARPRGPALALRATRGTARTRAGACASRPARGPARRRRPPPRDRALRQACATRP